MDRVFLDANVLFSAAYKLASPLRSLWSLPATELISSPTAVQEAQMNLARARPGQLPDLAALVAGLRLVADPPPGAVLPPAISLPDKDIPIFVSAADAQATHLLTGDLKHFGPYFGQTISGVLILRPAVYLQARQNKP